MTSEYPRCCLITNVFGYSLKQGIVIVAVSSIIISIATLGASLIFLLPGWSKETSYNTNPVKAIYFISSLFGISTSLYQIIITITMLWFMRWKKEVLLLWLWFVSNVVLLTFYFFLSAARTAICVNAREYAQAILNVILGIIYEALYTYFCIVVNSFELSLDPETIYY